MIQEHTTGRRQARVAALILYIINIVASYQES